MTTKTWSRNMGCLAIDPDQAGLVAGYDMVPRSDGTIEDKSGNGNHGTINGPAFEFTEIGPSMKFDGVDDGIESINNIDVSGLFSLICWFRTSSTGGQQVLMSRKNSAGNTVYFRIDNADGYARAVAVGSLSSVTNIYGPSTKDLRDGLYHMAVLTYNPSGNATVYVDCVPGTPIDVSGVGDLLTEILELGQRSSFEFLEGNLAFPKVITRVLTAAEIQAEYQAGAKAVNWKSDYGVTESVAAEATPGELSNSPARIISGTHKIATDTINGRTCKVVECVTSGVVAIPTAYFHGNDTQAAHGSFEWWMLKGADGNQIRIPIIANQPTAANVAGFNGYEFRFNTNESFSLHKFIGGASTVLHLTDIDFILNNTWYKCKTTISPVGVFTTYLNDTLIDVSGGSGTNPVTDTTFTTSKYTILDLDAGDKVAWASANGDCAITKYQGVV